MKVLTGFKDMNGNQILDGDLCKHYTKVGILEVQTVGVVKFYNGSYYLDSSTHLEKISKNLEVIGNVRGVE